MVEVTIKPRAGLDLVTKDKAKEVVLRSSKDDVLSTIIEFCDKYVAKENRHHFLQCQGLSTEERPKSGVIILVNEVDLKVLEDDQELGQYKLKNGDVLTLITTLHGG